MTSEDDNPEIRMLRELSVKFDERLMSFENQYTPETVVRVINELPVGYTSNAISRYQNIIRKNTWYFPILRDVTLESFLTRWADVHLHYFDMAERIFSILAKSKSLNYLASSSLLKDVIQSETTRGWVGKRSPSGLDKLLENRIAMVSELLSSFGDDTVDEILSLGGLYSNASEFTTAEHDIINQFKQYSKDAGKEMTATDSCVHNDVALSIIRNYCRYSKFDFNEKYRALCANDDVSLRDPSSAIAVDHEAILGQHLSTLTVVNRRLVLRILDEIKALNYLNLNLEVKYSFKGWAGLMHVLVFVACSELTGINDDVYDMLNNLCKKEN